MNAHCRARYVFIAVIFVLGIGQMIAACGQKGDLYLPEPEKETPETKAADAKSAEALQVQNGEQPNVEENSADVPKAPHVEVQTKAKQ